MCCATCVWCGTRALSGDPLHTRSQVEVTCFYAGYWLEALVCLPFNPPMSNYRLFTQVLLRSRTLAAHFLSILSILSILSTRCLCLVLYTCLVHAVAPVFSIARVIFHACVGSRVACVCCVRAWHVCVCVCACVDMCACACVCACVCVCVRACILSHICVCIDACMHVCMHARTHARTHASMHVRIHTHTSIYLRAYKTL